MKIQYKHQAFQLEAARAVVEAFQGQPKQGSSIYVAQPHAGGGLHDLIGMGNAPLELSREAIAANVRRVQLEQENSSAKSLVKRLTSLDTEEEMAESTEQPQAVQDE